MNSQDVLLSTRPSRPVRLRKGLSAPSDAMQLVLDTLTELGGKPLEMLTPTEARMQPTLADALNLIIEREGINSHPDISITLKQVTIHGGAGDIVLNIYTPPGKGPFPAMLYFHGGGFVLADTKTYDATPRALSKGAGMVIVGVDYHLAPEHPYPSALNDAYTAYLWVLLHTDILNVKQTQVAVGGESAGATLAALLCIRAREKQAPVPAHQLLIYPLTDNDFTTPSYVANAEASPLNRAKMQWFLDHYLAGSDQHHQAFPMKTASLRSLPSATVITAEIDPLRTEGQAYAKRLAEEGVAVECEDYLEVTHGFFGLAAVVPEARSAQEFAINALKKSFRKHLL